MIKEVDGYLFSSDENAHSEVYGVEVEYSFYPSPMQLRSINKQLLKSFKFRGTNPSDIFDFAANSVRENLVFLMKVYRDIESLELVTKPSSPQALNIQCEIICSIAQRLRRLGFSSYDPRSGVHVNVNTLNWGVDWEERKETLSRFLHFCFEQSHKLNNLYGRIGWDARKSDIYFLLGDYLGNDSPDMLYNKFKESLYNLLSRWEANENFYELNIGFNNHEYVRGLVEIRWFGSTDDPAQLKSYVDFVGSLIKFVRTTNEANNRTWDKYQNFVALNATHYLDLYDKIV